MTGGIILMHIDGTAPRPSESSSEDDQSNSLDNHMHKFACGSTSAQNSFPLFKMAMLFQPNPIFNQPFGGYLIATTQLSEGVNFRHQVDVRISALQSQLASPQTQVVEVYQLGLLAHWFIKIQQRDRARRCIDRIKEICLGYRGPPIFQFQSVMDWVRRMDSAL